MMIIMWIQVEENKNKITGGGGGIDEGREGEGGRGRDGGMEGWRERRRGRKERLANHHC